MTQRTAPFPHHREEFTADLIARLAHQGQTDKSGGAYIEHPRRVARILANSGYGLPYTVVGVLHDTVEDTEITLDDLRAVFSGDIVRAVDNLTRRRRETPEAYYERVRNGDYSQFVNAVSLTVKRADIMDNTSPARLAKLDGATRERLSMKYSKALEALGGPLTPARSD